ncbi:MAG: PA0069 family radical SAM protein, partial [Verrucomicrobia bacterium]
SWTEAGADGPEPGDGGPRLETRFYRDRSSSIITRNTSPDLGFDYSVNPYRGCEHGCAYCYARPYHEYLGFSAGLDFESRIMVKPEAPALLEAELASPKWTPGVIALSGVTDCYQPIERRLRLTRGCLEVLLDARNPVSVITKNRLVVRDVDLLREMAELGTVRVTLSMTTLDPVLARDLEPRTASPRARLEAIRRLSEAGVPTCVNLAPIIPGLNDHEIPAILEASARAGAIGADWALLRLPLAVKDIFLDWLDRFHPGKKPRILARLRDSRGGRLNSSAFGERLTGAGVFAEQIRALFRVAARRCGLDRPLPPLTVAHFRRPRGGQLEFPGLVGC